VEFSGLARPVLSARPAHAQELAYASQRLTSIEINGTFYRHQTPASFAAWAKAVPDGFVFAVKAHRATTHSKDPARAAEAVQQFLASGLTELGNRLGPILWQFPPYRAFAPDALESGRCAGHHRR
jgi:uncharacterized protein YecE (DUF72 family)